MWLVTLASGCFDLDATLSEGCEDDGEKCTSKTVSDIFTYDFSLIFFSNPKFLPVQLRLLIVVGRRRDRCCE
jgi:hypothetical protein